MKKSVLLCLFLFFIGFVFSQEKYTIEGIIENYQEGKLYLSNFYGDQNKIIDSVETDNKGYFQFGLEPSRATGLYRIILENNNFFDLIFNKENIRILTEASKLIESLEIISSKENNIYYGFLEKRGQTEYKIELLHPVVRFYPQENKFYPEARKEFVQIQNALQKYTDSIVAKYPEFYTTKIISMESKPALDPDLSPFEQKIYLRTHYFDNADFTDTSLLRSDVLSSKLIGYLSFFQNNSFTKDQLEESFIQAVDTILKKTRVNQLIYEFTLDYLIGGFNQYNFNKVLEYIAEHSHLEESCDYSEKTSELEKRIDVLKRLANGKEAPDFSVNDIAGKPVKLSSIDKDNILLVFYASWCPHCNHLIPELSEFYNNYENDDIEVIAVSIDTSENAYNNFLKQGNYNWINVCDFVGWDTQTAELYGIYATPTMILLNRDKIITGKPGNLFELKGVLEE